MNNIIWLTGLPCSGKSTIAQSLNNVIDGEILDGDEIRSLINNDNFSEKGRERHMLTVAAWANRLSQYTTVIVALVSPIRSVREKIISLYPQTKEVFLKCPVEECTRRDVKGMYKKALAGEIADFTGVNSPYEEPKNSFIVNTLDDSVEHCVKLILDEFFPMDKHSMFIGRFQPLHQGHIILINKVLEEGKKVCVALRITPVSEKNPYSIKERKQMFKKVFGDKVKIIAVPDIEDICYGREVGWGIREIRFDKEIESISATKIRETQKDINK